MISPVAGFGCYVPLYSAVRAERHKRLARLSNCRRQRPKPAIGKIHARGLMFRNRMRRRVRAHRGRYERQPCWLAAPRKSACDPI